jgi:hypothetical protein
MRSKLNLYVQTPAEWVNEHPRDRRRVRGLRLVKSLPDSYTNHEKLMAERERLLVQGQRPVLMTVVKAEGMNRAARRAFLRNPEVRAEARRMSSKAAREAKAAALAEVLAAVAKAARKVGGVE